MLLPIRHQTINAGDLKAKKCEVHVLLASKDKASIYVHITGAMNVYIVYRRNHPEYWTFNESQAVKVYNDAN